MTFSSAPERGGEVRNGNNIFGPLRIEWWLTQDGFAFDVRLFLSDQPVDHAQLTRQQPNYPFDVDSGITSADGVLVAQFATDGQAQKLSGDFDYCIQSSCQRYKGIIAPIESGQRGAVRMPTMHYERP